MASSSACGTLSATATWCPRRVFPAPAFPTTDTRLIAPDHDATTSAELDRARHWSASSTGHASRERLTDSSAKAWIAGADGLPAWTR